jgi:hypothetical protein
VRHSPASKGVNTEAENTVGIRHQVFSVRSVPLLYNEEKLRLRESLETAVRRAGASCETVAG